MTKLEMNIYKEGKIYKTESTFDCEGNIIKDEFIKYRGETYIYHFVKCKLVNIRKPWKCAG